MAKEIAFVHVVPRIGTCNGLKEIAERMERLAHEFRHIPHTTADTVAKAADDLNELMQFAGVVR